MRLIILSVIPQVLPELPLLPYHPVLRVSSSLLYPIFAACCYPLEYNPQGRLFKKSSLSLPATTNARSFLMQQMLLNTET